MVDNCCWYQRKDWMLLLVNAIQYLKGWKLLARSISADPDPTNLSVRPYLEYIFALSKTLESCLKSGFFKVSKETNITTINNTREFEHMCPEYFLFSNPLYLGSDAQICWCLSADVQQVIMWLSIVYGPHLHSRQHLGMLQMTWWMVSWGISYQTWIKASLRSWTVCGAIWWHWMHRQITSQRFSNWIQMWGTVNGTDAVIIQELPTHSGHMRLGIVLHQHKVCEWVRFRPRT